MDCHFPLDSKPSNIRKIGSIWKLLKLVIQKVSDVVLLHLRSARLANLSSSTRLIRAIYSKVLLRNYLEQKRAKWFHSLKKIRMVKQRQRQNASDHRIPIIVTETKASLRWWQRSERSSTLLTGLQKPCAIAIGIKSRLVKPAWETSEVCGLHWKKIRERFQRRSDFVKTIFIGKCSPYLKNHWATNRSTPSPSCHRRSIAKRSGA